MNPAAKKGRELLKAARSRTNVAVEEKREEDVKAGASQEENTNSVENVNTEVKSPSASTGGMLIEGSQYVEDSHHQKHDMEGEIEKILEKETQKPADNHPAEVKPKLNDRLAMFENKNKLGLNRLAATNVNMHTAGFSAEGNKLGLLNRMNRDKEPMKLIGVKPAEKVTNSAVKAESEVSAKKEDTDDTEQTTQEEVPHYEIPAPKGEEKVKLLNRIASAKGMKKTQSENKGMGKKTSERIMSLASMLQNKIIGAPEDKEKAEVAKMLGENGNKNQNKENASSVTQRKKFLLSGDDDIQLIDDDHHSQVGPGFFDNKSKTNVDRHNLKPEIFENKDIMEILMEKPITKKNVKKRTKTAFNIVQEEKF